MNFDVKDNFNWLGSNNYHVSKEDVSINRIKFSGKENKYGFGFTFRNDVWQFFGEFIEVAIYKNRVFIKSSKNGVRVKDNGTGAPNRYARLRETEETRPLKDFIGDYELKYDDFYELYYIERV